MCSGWVGGGGRGTVVRGDGGRGGRGVRGRVSGVMVKRGGGGGGSERCSVEGGGMEGEDV